MIPHLYFRRRSFQLFLRCQAPGCGFVAREKGAHIAHAQGRDRDEQGADL
jgi:hypothetical protein